MPWFGMRFSPFGPAPSGLLGPPSPAALFLGDYYLNAMTDEASQYGASSKHFAGHGFTRHGAGQYVNCENPTIDTNTIEGAFSI